MNEKKETKSSKYQIFENYLRTPLDYTEIKLPNVSSSPDRFLAFRCDTTSNFVISVEQKFFSWGNI